MEKTKRRAVETLYTPEMALIESRMHDIRTKLLMIGRESRFAAGFYGGLVKGFMWGLIISLLLFGAIFAYFAP